MVSARERIVPPMAAPSDERAWQRPLRAIIVGALSWICFGMPSSAALVGSEFQINTYTTAYQGLPAVAAAPNGSFVVLWSDEPRDGSGFGVFGQRFDSTGAFVGTDFAVNTYTTADQLRPSAAAATDGSFVVAWHSYLQNGGTSGVFGQRFDSVGQSLGTEFQISSHTTGGQLFPTVTVHADSAFVAAWRSDTQDGDSTGVYARRYDSTGAALGTEFQVNSYTTSVQYHQAIASHGDGAFVVVWESESQDGDLAGVFGQRYDSAGQAVGTEFQVNTCTTSYQYFPMVAASPNGTFVVVWQSYGQDGSGAGVFAQRYGSGGQPEGSEFQVNTHTTGYQGTFGLNGLAVSATADGAFVIVWQAFAQDGDRDGIFGQRYNSAGQPLGPEFQINTYATDDQRNPALGLAADGSGIVVWTSSLQDAGTGGIYGQRLGPPTPCGNATVDPGEECDDGNITDGDGCDANCTNTACGNGVATLGEECDDGNALDGDGCSSACVDTASAENAADAELVSGETISTDDENDGATAADAVETTIAMSVGTAAVTIAEASGQSGPVPGFAFIGQQVHITFSCAGAPCPTASAPLLLMFRVDSSRIPGDLDETTLAVLRDGLQVPACDGAPGVADPDPCVTNRHRFIDGDVGLTVLTSQASVWSFARMTCSPTPLTCDDPGKGVLLVERPPGDPAASKLLSKWLKGTVSSAASFGNPLAGTSYAVCVYDGTALVESHLVAPRGECGGRPCWKQLGSKGFGYKNPTGNDDGITKLLLKSGAGKAKILIKGAGARLGLPTTDPIYAQTAPVTVQLVAPGAGCWQASYAGPAKKSTSEKFKDIAP